ncbi:MAG: hypothetical protein A4S09_14200 [Proteobacteria bacterium SG_bin7]|nr:MAG: hypothetical protein A4S09_14200 [Proteobacteria bacterium SG_bin7]
MGYKFDENTKSWIAFCSKRHPRTRVPYSLRRKGIKTEAEAKRIEKQLLWQLMESFATKAEGMKFKSLLPKFYENMRTRGLSETTIETYQLCLDAHSLPIWGEKRIDSITTQEIVDLIKVKLAHRSPSHQKSMLKFIRAAFQFAVENNWLARNPTPRLQIRIGNKIKAVLTKEQARILLEKAKEYEHEWYPVWAVALYTGMRNGELHALTWDKVSFENRTILVSSSWDKKNGFKDLTKSGEDRIVEIAENLVYVLKELKLKNSDSPFVLPRIDSWDVGRQAEILRAYLYALGLPRIRFHDLRASWATILLGQGVEPVKIMKMGGWKDIKTMMIYIRKAGIDIKGVTDGLVLHNPVANPVANVINLKST